MKGIGFKNFRKFEDFPAINLGDITILVGKNNSGKSTIVKSLLLISNFISGMHNASYEIAKNKTGIKEIKYKVDLDVQYAHIGTWERALRITANSDDILAFSWKTERFAYSIELQSPEDNDKTYAYLKSFTAKENDFENIDGFKVTVNFDKPSITVFVPKDVDIDENFKNSNRILSYPIKYKHNINVSTGFILMDALRSILSGYDEKHFRMPSLCTDFYNEQKSCNDNRSYHKSFYGRYNLFCEYLFDDLQNIPATTEYIYAHWVSQKPIYTIFDGDFMSETIRLYAKQNIAPQSPAHAFITQWMSTFKIGKDFSIIPIQGESYMVKVQSFDDKNMNLCDNGMGPVRIMILLLRLAIIIDKICKNNETKRMQIIIEEPEQNLHPDFQSKLTELICEMNRKYKVQFIIETHSEYMIRKMQVLVAKKGINSEPPIVNPDDISIFYINSQEDIAEEEPQVKSIEICTDGRITTPFGSGFFDEADNHAMELLRLKIIQK
jgi:predicted ATPase